MAKKVSEAASEKEPTRPVGRPRVFPLELRALMGQSAGERWTRELCYGITAIKALNHDPEFHWLWNKAVAERGGRGPGIFQASLLAELGRIYATLAPAYGEEHARETTREYARQLCEMKPLVKRGLELLRLLRKDMRTKIEAAIEQAERTADAKQLLEEDDPNGTK